LRRERIPRSKRSRPAFIKDLNGDGTIGPITTVIEALGSTSLVQVGNNYFLDPVAGGTGPELKISGAPVVAGQSGGWTPIGAEQTATGYEIAWKLAGSNEYSVWATDSNGNYTSNLIGTASGTASVLEAIETSFHQDLNGDGTIGISPAPASSISAMMAKAGNDNFVFRSDLGAAPAVAPSIDLDRTSRHPPATQISPRSLAMPTTTGILFNRHLMAIITTPRRRRNLHIADLHANHFIIH
jgi:hypothetical protein